MYYMVSVASNNAAGGIARSACSAPIPSTSPPNNRLRAEAESAGRYATSMKGFRLPGRQRGYDKTLG